ncbi:MAG: xylosidase, partial [Acidobacteriota bacterium]|nr:xylosidase [Acidobacteriota bacterium]
LSAFGDMENALGIAATGDGKIVIWRREKKEHKIVETVDAPNSAVVHLRMRARGGQHYRFHFSRDGKNWQGAGGELDGFFLPPWDRGVRVALTAGGADAAIGKFGYLRIEPSR